jgi:hypothetical protein
MQAGWTVTDASNNAIISSAGTGSNPYDVGNYVVATNYVIHTVQTKHTVHSPNTTDSFTYKLRAENDTADNIKFNPTGGNGSTITLMEIAG